ncbi:hypothetical protein QBC35DRAFT_31381 [Podospora australis]|uniref:Secreted protein n=1 Tax=Podospora australis TaxID=1536484 RepID=A0AAN6WMW6_9PEZI|nr:hypothetical protein QBC35DRAFT_31381 [Podospora australis]
MYPRSHCAPFFLLFFFIGINEAYLSIMAHPYQYYLHMRYHSEVVLKHELEKLFAPGTFSVEVRLGKAHGPRLVAKPKGMVSLNPSSRTSDFDPTS